MIANSERANATNKYAAVTSIPIADQMARDLLPVPVVINRRTVSSFSENLISNDRMRSTISWISNALHTDYDDRYTAVGEHLHGFAAEYNR
jgi:hypothetical protein